MKEDLTTFNEEKSALELEQGRLETRLKEIGDEKEDLRSKLRDLIQVKSIGAFFIVFVRFCFYFTMKRLNSVQGPFSLSFI